jgi:hypothetical protein
MPAVVPVLRPAAEIVTGEVTVEPLRGEQIFTPGVDGTVQPPPPDVPTVKKDVATWSSPSVPTA